MVFVGASAIRRYIPSIFSKIKTIPSTYFRRAVAAPVARKLVFSGLKTGARRFGVVAGAEIGLNVARAVASRDWSKLKPSAFQAGTLAGSPFGIFGAIAGGAIGAGVDRYIAKKQGFIDRGGDLIQQGYGEFQDLRNAPYTPANPLLAKLKDLVGGYPDLPEPQGFAQAPQQMDYPDFDIKFPDVHYPDIQYPDFSVNVAPPQVSIPVSADVGGGGFAAAALAALAGAGALGYAVGRKRKKKRKYKRRKSSR